jgi:acyl carrier protein
MNLSRREIEERTETVIARLFQLDRTSVSSLNREKDERWTSLMHVEIFFALEEEFLIQVDEDEIAFAENLSDLVDIVANRLDVQ